MIGLGLAALAVGRRDPAQSYDTPHPPQDAAHPPGLGMWGTASHPLES